MSEMLEVVNNEFCEYEKYCKSEGLNMYEVGSYTSWIAYIELEYNMLGGF